MAKRPVIGFLINDIVGAYQFGLWSGIDAACCKLNIDLIVFTGGELGANDPVKAIRNRIFSLANEKNVDGLILSASAIGNHLSNEKIAEFCRSFYPIPLVTLAIEVPGIPSVLIGHVDGIESAIEHLITVHNRRNIAFIGGTPGNPDAKARLEAYRRVLKHHGIALDPIHEEIANFDHRQGKQAMELLLMNDPSIDAVVAANDEMALGALEALQEQGIEIPEKIALCGFDDIDDCKFCTPPLFTVRQPLFDQGYKCVEMLSDMIYGKECSASSIVIPAVIVPRESCGCSLEKFNVANQNEISLLKTKLTDAQITIKKEIFERAKIERQIWELQELSAYLVNTFDTRKVIDYLSRRLPSQGILTAYLLLNSESDEFDTRLMMAIADDTVFPLPREGLPVQKGALFPEGHGYTGGRRTLMVEPLYFESSSLGFFVYATNPRRGMIFDALRTTISAALQGARLVHQVRLRTDELESANIKLQDIAQKVHDILDNIKQGLFTVNLDGTINPEHSKSVETILGISDLQNSSLREIMRLNSVDESNFLKWLDLVKSQHTSMRWEKLVRLAPVQELQIGFGEKSRYIHFSYQKMYDRFKHLQKIMVLAIDVTESRKIEQIVAAEKERHEYEVRIILGLINNVPEIIQDYLQDTSLRIESVSVKLSSMLEPARFAREHYPQAPAFVPAQDDIIAISRDLHTIKGNSATFGFDKLSKIAHEAEDLVLALKEPIEMRVTVTITELLNKISFLKAAYDEILAIQARLNFSNGDTIIPLPEKRIEKIREIARSIESELNIISDPIKDTVKPLLSACEHIRDIPLLRLTEKYRSLVMRLSDKLNKKVKFEVIPADLELPPHFLSSFDEALVHIFRNSLDHGIEHPEERKILHKPEVGSIVLELSLAGDGLIIRISDDGCGIDIGNVVERAVQQKIISLEEASTLSLQEKLMLIFEAGISTAREVTDISGRGIGMAAVKRNVEALHGSVNVFTNLGMGTTVEIKIVR